MTQKHSMEEGTEHMRSQGCPGQWQCLVLQGPTITHHLADPERWEEALPACMSHMCSSSRQRLSQVPLLCPLLLQSEGWDLRKMHSFRESSRHVLTYICVTYHDKVLLRNAEIYRLCPHPLCSAPCKGAQGLHIPVGDDGHQTKKCTKLLRAVDKGGPLLVTLVAYRAEC